MNKYEMAVRHGYTVDKYGNVYGLKGNLIKQHVGGGGYLKITASLGESGTVNLYVHRLMATFWLDLKCSKLQVDHINGDKHDNRLDNLELVTPSENIRRWVAQTGKNRGERANGAKLTNSQAQEIRQKLSEGVVSLHLAKQYKVTPMVISNIKMGRSYA